MSSSLVGSRIAHFRIVDEIGRGGMGEVYVGFDEKLERKVALKVIRSEHRLVAESKARFEREARVLSQLAHPGICRIYDYISGQEADFLVLELIEGHALTDLLGGATGLGRKLEMARDLTEVLVAAHAKGIVHRDLKPDNVMVTTDGRLKVLDFGLSRSSADEESIEIPTATLEAAAHASRTGAPVTDDSRFRTQLGSVVGTIGYMSPEQAKGEPATSASDVFSLGVVLQELFTGESAFDRSGSLGERLERARGGKLVPARGLDAELVTLLGRMTAISPQLRPTAVEVLESLDQLLSRPAHRRRLRIAAMAVPVAGAILFGALTMHRQLVEQTEKFERTLGKALATSSYYFVLFSLEESLEDIVTVAELDDRVEFVQFLGPNGEVISESRRELTRPPAFRTKPESFDMGRGTRLEGAKGRGKVVADLWWVIADSRVAKGIDRLGITRIADYRTRLREIADAAGLPPEDDLARRNHPVDGFVRIAFNRQPLHRSLTLLWASAIGLSLAIFAGVGSLIRRKKAVPSAVSGSAWREPRRSGPERSPFPPR